MKGEKQENAPQKDAKDEKTAMMFFRRTYEWYIEVEGVSDIKRRNL